MTVRILPGPRRGVDSCAREKSDKGIMSPEGVEIVLITVMAELYCVSVWSFTYAPV